MEVYKNKFSSEAELENALEEFLKICLERTELFVPSEEERFKFFHRSFFEYFYAKYITKRFHSAVERLNELIKFDIDSEIFELTVAMLKQDYEQDYQALIGLHNILGLLLKFKWFYVAIYNFLYYIKKYLTFTIYCSIISKHLITP